MTKCRYKTVETIKKHYGNDWSNLILEDVYFTDQDLRGIILPKDTEVFQRIRNKSLAGTYLPKGNYSNYNFNEVSLYGTYFTPDSELGDNKMLFQNIENKNLMYAHIPEGDYSKHNFDGVCLKLCKFTKDSIFSSDKEIFQKIKDKDLTGTSLPEGDYSRYNFNGVTLCGTNFQNNTILPEHEDFLSNAIYKNGCRLTKNVMRNIHNYNLKNVSIDLDVWHGSHLTQEQIDILKAKYPEAIEERKIILPNEVYGDTETDNSYKF